MATTNLNIPEVAASQNQKELTINNALNALDEATQGEENIAIVGNTVLTAAQLRSDFMLKLIGAPAAAFSVTIPGNIKRFFAVRNETEQTATITLGASTLELERQSQAIFYTDGTEILSIGGIVVAPDTPDTVSAGLSSVVLYTDADHVTRAKDAWHDFALSAEIEENDLVFMTIAMNSNANAANKTEVVQTWSFDGKAWSELEASASNNAVTDYGQTRMTMTKQMNRGIWGIRKRGNQSLAFNWDDEPSGLGSTVGIKMTIKKYS